MQSQETNCDPEEVLLEGLQLLSEFVRGTRLKYQTPQPALVPSEDISGKERAPAPLDDRACHPKSPTPLHESSGLSSGSLEQVR